jgi:cytochrome P450
VTPLRQSPTDPAFVQDPYPFYDHARASGDLFFWEDYGLPMAISHRAVSSILKDRRLGREPIEPPAFPDHVAAFYAVEAHSMLELEPPRHTRLRGLVLRAFTNRRIKALAPEIEALCHSLIDAFPEGEVDLLPAYCQRVPVIVIARLLGVPEQMSNQLLAWSNAMVGMYQARRTRAMEDAAARAAADFAAFMRTYVEERRSRPADDLITHLIAAEAEGEKLTTDELITTCILLLNAGHEATVHTMGNGVKALLENRTPPDALAPDRVEATVEEILRYDPPLHLFTRHVYEEVELFGHRFRRGDQVGCLLAAANRDPAVWPDPARFDPARPVQTNLSFGAGLHFCVGAPLARLELQVALPVLFQRFPALVLAEPPRYANLYHFHGLERLKVTGTPGAPI